MPEQPWSPDRPDIAALLLESEPVEQALLASGSNYVFLLTLRHATEGTGYAVYKPRRGEAPLWDFANGSLYKRERAAYLVSEALGWRLVPPTVVREDGLQYGIGAVQLFISHDPALNYFHLRDDHADEMRRVALFDWLTNNADRKGGSSLVAPDGRIWWIDHGLTFHEEDKLRTVIWDYEGEPVAPALLSEVCAFGERLQTDATLREELASLLLPEELTALVRRIERIDQRRRFPPVPAYRPYPWPII
jgi:hypothetical protein